jgi:hypothetical protein
MKGGQGPISGCCAIEEEKEGDILNMRRVMVEKNLTRLKWNYLTNIKMHVKEIDSGKLNFTELVYDETKWLSSVPVVHISGPITQRTIGVTKQIQHR